MAQSKVWTRLPSWLIYPVGMMPAVYLFYAAFTNQLGADPLDALENELGEWALKFLVVGLLFTPLLKIGRINLTKYRRAIGLIAFAYVFLHLAVYVALDRQFGWWEIWGDIVKRPYITIGMAAFILLLPLAVTSNNASIKRLGTAVWRNLHKLAYPAVLFGALHYVLLKKTWEPEPLVYLAIILVLLGWRFMQFKRAGKNA
jgi:sulfoxide reductase heme-binding subunit YedZ